MSRRSLTAVLFASTATSLHRTTSPAAIGRNTVTAIQSGLIYGYVGLVEGMVARFKQELGADTKVVGTGGLADLIAPETAVLEYLAPWLTLDGLQMIWKLNRDE